MKKMLMFNWGVMAILGAVLLFPSCLQAEFHHIFINGGSFTPPNSSTQAGNTVIWTNNDPINHTVTSDQFLFFSGNIGPNGTFSVQFPDIGTFPYHCTLHPSEVDTLHITEPLGIREPESSPPASFELTQNYPNPFNSETSINFVLASSGHALLEVYDILGRHLDTLLNGNFNPGYYGCVWDAGARQSGIFFYRLTFNGETKTGRMTLLK